MPIRRRGGSGGTALSENIVDALEGAASPAAGNPFATVEDIPADLSSDIKAALTGAASPSAANPFATMADVGGEDDKTVKASSSDTTPGFLDAKVDNVTIEVAEDKLRLKSGGHTHPQSEVTDLVTALSGKASTAVATTSANGLMSSTDKTRLDALELAALTIASIESY